ncbi:hypothetical protein EDC63_107142 [Sulfurirhabdus autotrophica]|uniref:Uncharacterized protein n=1 Tax=Sulfurirhabdus autotrophica TaxID=1706046 RepID=A0A4R3Y4G9_9PROT|nr:hypothetical protein EDC63_107142 [Sulfurirhabdus autotrophica]
MNSNAANIAKPFMLTLGMSNVYPRSVDLAKYLKLSYILPFVDLLYFSEWVLHLTL